MPRGIKRLGYRAQVPVTQPGQAGHWDGFTFTGGPVQVIYKGKWGQMQVWASSEQEGIRVVEHACAGAGIDPNDTEGEWFYSVSSSPRHQRIATYRTAKKYGLPVVTVRDGPSGPALIEPP
jgi:hypothetical protein